MAFPDARSHGQLGGKTVNRAWREAFHPEYDGSGEHRGITSHFGRRFFTTYWRIVKDLDRELIQYMRGDITGRDAAGNRLVGREAIDEYIHTALFRRQISRVTGVLTHSQRY